MAQIPRKYIDNYTKALNKLSEDAKKKLADDLAKIDFTQDVATVRDAVIERMEFYCGPYTDMAAMLAAEFYDGVRELSTGKAIGALVESGREPIATEKAVRGIMQDIVEGKAADTVVQKLTDRVDYEIKKSAGECIYRNGANDPLKPRYARVPSGSETCSFCIMLASRGFVYRDSITAGEGNHYHPNCDCRIVQGYDHIGYGPSRRMSISTKIEGYDMDALYDQYLEDLKSGKLNYEKLQLNAANSKRGKRGKHSESGSGSHVGRWSSEKFESYGDFANFVKESESIEDLQERCAIATAEWSKTGLSDKNWDELKLVVLARRKELETVIERMAEP